MNINFPAVPVSEVKGNVVTRQGKRDLSNLLIDARMDARGREYYWLGYRPSPGSPGVGDDLHAVAAGEVSITPLNLNLTATPLMDSIAESLA